MATQITPSLRAALERMKHAGAVNGLCLGWRRQVLINLTPYEGYRAEQLMHAVQEVREHFAKGGREVQHFWFGFDGVQVLACYHGECSLAVLHTRAVEVDFIARAAATFLADAQLLVDAALNSTGSDATGADTQELEDSSGGSTNFMGRVML